MKQRSWNMTDVIIICLMIGFALATIVLTQRLDHLTMRVAKLEHQTVVVPPHTHLQVVP